MGNVILALDVGTSATHCLLADSLGRPIATASAPLNYFTPEGCPPLAKEFDPEVVLETLGRITCKVLEEAGIVADDISAIAITGQRQGVVFLDTEGKEIYSGPNIDLRAIFEGAAIDEELGQEIYATTGHFPSLLLAPARLRWFRENQPQIYDSTCTILTIAGWLAYRLTGRLISEPSLEGEAGLLDINGGERCPDLMDKLGVSLSLLPPLLKGGVAAGTLDQRMARRWALGEGIPVLLAGPDTQCGLLGLGLVKEGGAGALIGWSGSLQVITSRPHYDEDMRTWVGCYPLDGLWVEESSLGDAGNAYRWLKDTLLGKDASFGEAERMAGEASAAPEGVVAFLGPGPISASRGGLKLGGLLFPTPLCFQEATRGQLFRAILENIAYSMKANLAVLREVSGLNPQVLYLGGGMAGSWTLATTLANVLGFPIRLSKLPQVSARGAALLAAVSSDPSLSLDHAAEIASNDCEEVEPSTPSEVAQYVEHYHQWLHLSKRLEWGQD